MWYKGIINKSLPSKNKYVNFLKVETINTKQMSIIDFKNSVNLIQNHYLQTDDTSYLPSDENIKSYFKNHNMACFFSFYKTPKFLVETKSNKVIDTTEIIGVVTSRPFYLHFNKKEFHKSLNVYYIDYLCIHSSYRKKNITCELLQTHEYNQRRLNKNVNICLFKREGHIMFITPLVLYNAYCYDTSKWIYPPLKSIYKCQLVNKNNLHLFLELLNASQKLFYIAGFSGLENIVSLITIKSIYVYILTINNRCIGGYFFRNSMLKYDTGTAIECFGSICICDNTLFNLGFMNSYKNVSKALNTRYLIIEDISHNTKFVKHMLQKQSYEFKSPYAYYLYNYAYKTLNREEVFLLI